MFSLGCSTGGETRVGRTASVNTHEQFWAKLESLCGQAFEGQIAVDSTRSDDFAGQRMVMHVMRCDSGVILVPFHVGENRSRTWVFTKTGRGLRLKHDHRMPDGTDDDLTWYGGDTQDAGTPTTQEFYADSLTAEMLPEAATNIWTVEIVPGEVYAYALRREGTDRRFRVEFDLTNPIEPPPLPWGHERPRIN
ncbi:MAG: hypothetical protein EA378_10855 [Phycisphaerales bacterium]|nr:MAG: hypothetical protein EA378_10855 [Phycisphaerales bacterium]